MNNVKKLKLEDLKLGMEVQPEQLSEIYDTWILIEETNVGAKTGIIKWIGKTPNKESQKILESGKVIGCIFNDSIELDGDVFFDE